MKPHPKNENILVLTKNGEPTNEVAKYSDVGCYPLFYMAQDGGIICPGCVQEHLPLCIGDEGDTFRDQWKIIAHDANWEDPNLKCEHCEKRIESAYAEDDSDETESDSAKESDSETEV